MYIYIFKKCRWRRLQKQEFLGFWNRERERVFYGCEITNLSFPIVLGILFHIQMENPRFFRASPTAWPEFDVTLPYTDDSIPKADSLSLVIFCNYGEKS